MNAEAPLLPDELAFYHRLQRLGGLVYVYKMETFAALASNQVIEIFSPAGVHLYTGKLGSGRGGILKTQTWFK